MVFSLHLGPGPDSLLGVFQVLGHLRQTQYHMLRSTGGAMVPGQPPQPVLPPRSQTKAVSAHKTLPDKPEGQIPLHNRPSWQRMEHPAGLRLE